MIKLFLEYNGEQYLDFEGIIFNKTYKKKDGTYGLMSDISDEKNIVYLNETMLNSTKDKIKQFGEQKVPIGSKIYCSGKSPYAMADIRKNYTLKRSSKSADYTIISNEFGNYYWEYYYNKILIVPDAKVVAMCMDDRKIVNPKEAMKEALLDIYPREFFGDGNFYYVDYAYLAHFESSFTENYQLCCSAYNINTDYKVRTYNALQLSTGNPVTIDALKILKNACEIKGWDTKSEETCVNAIMSFNNLDWRDYPGTIYAFQENLDGGIFRNISGAPSRQPKPVREFIEFRNKNNLSFKDEKDFELGQQYFGELLGITGTKYVSMLDLLTKLKEKRVTLSVYNELFGAITQIKPKTYEKAVPQQ